MSVCYQKLWHILLDRKMKKRDLQRAANLSEYMIKKLTRDESVPAEVLGKISKVLHCSIEDFVEFSE